MNSGSVSSFPGFQDKLLTPLHLFSLLGVPTQALQASDRHRILYQSHLSQRVTYRGLGDGGWRWLVEEFSLFCLMAPKPPFLALLC